MIVLHQWRISPFCGKVRRLLRHKGLEFEVVDYNGLRSRQAKKLTRPGKLPVLEVGDQLIPDSSAIADYLEREHPEPSMWPAGDDDRQLAHFFEDWADESLYWFEVYFRFADDEALERATEHLCEGRPGWEKALFRPVARRLHWRKLLAQGLARYPREEVERRFFGHLDQLDRRLDGRDHLVGDGPSIADIAVASQLVEVQRTSTIADRIGEGRPALARWLERQGENL